MKFFFAKIFFIFLFVGISNASENIRFININFIVNNSEAGKSLNKIIENKSKKITTELNNMGKKIENKKDKIISQKNILKNSGKPEEIAKKISLGKMNKFKEENALITQAWVMEPKKKVQDVLKELAVNDLKIKEFSRIKIGE